ncbi:MAG: enoyl-CoA hydratase/isomerase family protein [Woeseia sp.]|nr:enoyl-CoA hydratase/isomerase family protein [Woeseia sp.]
MPVEKDETITVDVKSGVCVVTLNRPGKLNAINEKMSDELRAVHRWVEKSESVNVVVLNGNGRAFCVGFDLQEADDSDSIPGVLENRKILESDLELIMGFWHCSKPTISAVQGYCLAGGCELALACDITIAAENAYFGEPELRFGVGIGCMILPWLTGPKQAKELYFTGNDRVTAQRALSMGLINQVVPEGDALRKALEMAREIAVMDTDAMMMTKKAVNRSYEIMGMQQGMSMALDIDVEIASMDTPDRRMFREISQRDGLKAAIAWRDARFSED